MLGYFILSDSSPHYCDNSRNLIFGCQIKALPCFVFGMRVPFALTSLADEAIFFGVTSGYKSGDVICKLDNREYYKLNDGWALGAYYFCNTGYTGPILVSDEKENVSYKTSRDSKIFTYHGTVEYNGKTYYYSSIEYFMEGNNLNQIDNGLYRCSNGEAISPEAAALEVLKKGLRE